MKQDESELLIHCDGGSRGNPGQAAAAFIVYRKNREVYSEGFALGIATNNIAEYTAVLKATEWLIKNNLNDEKVSFKLDSQLVVNQLNGIFKVRDRTILTFVVKIKEMEKNFQQKIKFNYVPRDQNKIADMLVNKTLDENI